jgi:hypothetical protein
MKTSVVTVQVTCPKCRTMYQDRYMPAPALPEVHGIGLEYSDDCIVTTCPACDHVISAVIMLSNEGKWE